MTSKIAPEALREAITSALGFGERRGGEKASAPPPPAAPISVPLSHRGRPRGRASTCGPFSTPRMNAHLLERGTAMRVELIHAPPGRPAARQRSRRSSAAAVRRSAAKARSRPPGPPFPPSCPPSRSPELSGSTMGRAGRRDQSPRGRESPRGAPFPKSRRSPPLAWTRSLIPLPSPFLHSFQPSSRPPPPSPASSRRRSSSRSG